MAVHSKRVLITGSSGFTGRKLFDALRSRGHVVQGLSRTPGEFLHVSEHDSLRDVISNFRPSHVVHLAGISFPAHPVNSEVYNSNVLYSAELLDSLIGMDLQQVIVVSSAAVYGQTTSTEPISEEVPPSPISHYALSKVFVEQMCGLYSKSLPILITRPFNYIGRGQAEYFFVSKIIKAFKSDQASLSLGNIDIVRDFSDVRDVIEAYIGLIENDCVGGVVNICSGVGIRLREILDIVSRITGRNLEVLYDPKFVRPNEPKVMVGCDKHLNSLIGERQKRPICDTLKWIIENDPDK
ncbi:NAD-dependent epimerase/dehydratase family protein [Asticcacaulis sp. W401b]|uniref:NAD-dependent epimerase/dehydratase family protein n=1 Tax=Asticcacaulis sp. W401b TaxID=3388666 RepID=UPI003970C563